MKEVGMRVGAILSANKDEVHLLGYGVYDGEHEAPFGPFGMSLEEHKELLKEIGQEYRPLTNPRITLDDGSVVWGMQCWWGPEEKVKESVGDRKVVIVDLDGNPKPEAK